MFNFVPILQERQFLQLSVLFPIKWTRPVSRPVINRISLSVIGHVMDVVPVSTPWGMHLFTHKETITALGNEWKRQERGMTGMVIQVQSSCLPWSAIKAQFSTKPDAIYKAITLMISCLPNISLRYEDGQGLTPNWVKLREHNLQEQPWDLARMDLNWRPRG